MKYGSILSLPSLTVLLTCRSYPLPLTSLFYLISLSVINNWLIVFYIRESEEADSEVEILNGITALGNAHSRRGLPHLVKYVKVTNKT